MGCYQSALADFTSHQLKQLNIFRRFSFHLRPNYGPKTAVEF
jgi:hypothetical protein